MILFLRYRKVRISLFYSWGTSYSYYCYLWGITDYLWGTTWLGITIWDLRSIWLGITTWLYYLGRVRIPISNLPSPITIQKSGSARFLARLTIPNEEHNSKESLSPKLLLNLQYDATMVFHGIWLKMLLAFPTLPHLSYMLINTLYREIPGICIFLPSSH